MKKTFLFATAVLFALFTYAQKPGNSGRGFQYQAVARDANGNIRQNQQIDIKFSFLASVNANTIHWAETHSPTTDAYGTFSVIIGEGIKDENSLYAEYKLLPFSIDWWLRIEIRIDGYWIPLSNQKLLSVPYAENVAPIGTIEIFAGPAENVPDGYMLCDGSNLNRTEFSELFNIIGTAWGWVNESTFKIPDLFGVFLRGVAHGSGRDPNRDSRSSYSGGNSGDKVGSYQDDQFASHNHTTRTVHASGANGSDYGLATHTQVTTTYSYGGDSNNPKIGYEGGKETRPKNVYVNYIIKVK